MACPIQIPAFILPLNAALPTSIGIETETVADLVAHTSIEFPCEDLQEKVIHITAVEIVVAGVPGNLWCWVELSPFLTVTTGNYWAAIGGGGGVLAPVAPLIEVATGVNLTVHGIMLPWTIHSPYARLVIRTPVAAALPGAFWVIQAVVYGKG